jgi:glutaminyl-tRNA synthetase
LPQQHEFARLNLTYTVMSKRKLLELVEGGYVDGWDDPRMPTLVGLRRRGYTPESIRLFAERIGVSKSDSWIDISVLEDCLRDELNERAERRIAVLDPLKLVIDNYPDDGVEDCFAPNHPQHPELGRRALPLTRELWMERDDFQEHPPQGYFRLSPGAEVRLRYGYVIRCVGFDKDESGAVAVVHCTYDPATRSGTPGAEARKVKGNIHWLSARHAERAEVRLYDRLFVVPQPGRARDEGAIAPPPRATADAAADGEIHFDEPTERNYLDDLNPQAKRVVAAYVEKALVQASGDARYQFERHGYFVPDGSNATSGWPVYNRAVTLRDSWGKDVPGKR